MDTSLVISLLPETSSISGSNNSLKIEQRPWGDYVGKVTSTDFLVLADMLLYNGSGISGMDMYSHPFRTIDTMIARMKMISQSLSMDCGFNSDKSISVELYVYAVPLNLSYSLFASYGVLTRKQREYIDQSEIIPVNYTESIELKYPVQGIKSFQWEGDTWDDDGNIVLNPTITVKAGVLYLSSKVYGIISIKYFTVRDIYKLTVHARKDSKIGLFESVVYGVYNGGVEYLKVTPPPNADEIASGDSVCGWDWSVTIIIEGEEDICRIPEVDGDRNISIEYCSQKEIK